MPCPACSVFLELLNFISRWAPLSWPTGVLCTSRPAVARVDAPPPLAPFPQGHTAVSQRSVPAGSGLALRPQPDQQEQVTSHPPTLRTRVTALQVRHQICLCV